MDIVCACVLVCVCKKKKKKKKKSVWKCVTVKERKYIYTLNMYMAATEIFINNRKNCYISKNIYANNNIHSILDN